MRGVATLPGAAGTGSAPAPANAAPVPDKRFLSVPNTEPLRWGAFAPAAPAPAPLATAALPLMLPAIDLTVPR